MINKVIIIAEVGVNHNGDISKAFQLIDAAAVDNVQYLFGYRLYFQTSPTDIL